MNFQSVSVGQKLVDPRLSCVRSNNAPGCGPNYVPGGYEPGTLALTPQLNRAMGFVDASIGRMVDGLETENLLGSTQIIISAKHGQSPIEPAQVDKIGHAVGTVLGSTTNFIIDDDAALVWEVPGGDAGGGVICSAALPYAGGSAWVCSWRTAWSWLGFRPR